MTANPTPIEPTREAITAALAEHFGCDPDNVAKWPAPMRLDAERRMIDERRAAERMEA